MQKKMKLSRQHAWFTIIRLLGFRIDGWLGCENLKKIIK